MGWGGVNSTYRHPIGIFSDDHYILQTMGWGLEEVIVLISYDVLKKCKFGSGGGNYFHERHFSVWHLVYGGLHRRMWMISIVIQGRRVRSSQGGRRCLLHTYSYYVGDISGNLAAYLFRRATA